MKLALVHDWLNQIGGAEDVLQRLVDMYPESPIYTSIYDRDGMPPLYQQWDIRPLWMNRLPAIYSHHQPYLPLYPIAWQGLDLSAYDVVLSNKSGFCHGFKKDDSTLHICYCLAPTRYVWQLDAYIAREGFGLALGAALKPLMSLLRRWDYNAAQQVDHFIAISSEIQGRIQRYYQRDSVIIYPPVETARFKPVAKDEVEDYYLIISRLIPYKRIDLAIQAANELGLPLKIGGKGRDMERLQAMAGPTVEFLGYVPDEELPDLMARCQAFLFPGLEDFGITPVQAQAAGRPVIAFGSGGALDTVIPGVTGEHFHELTAESLIEVLRQFDAGKYDTETIQRHAQKFDVEVFRRRLVAYVEQAYDAFKQKRAFSWQDPIGEAN